MAERSPGVWRLRVYIGEGAKGPQQASRTFRGGRRGAENALRAFVGEVERSRSKERQATVATLMRRWLEHRASRDSYYTAESAARVVKNHIIPVLGAIRLDRLSAADLDRAYGRWLVEGASPSTVHKRHATIAAALQQALKWGWVTSNVARLASPPSAGVPATRSPSPEEVRALIALAEDSSPPLAAAIALAALTGARRGELCALRWSDLDGETLVIARSLSSLAGGGYSLGPTKTHQTRRVLLDPVGVALLARHRAWQRWHADAFEAELDADPWLLSRAVDGASPMLPVGLSHSFARIAARAGLPYHFHELRHFAATVAISSGHNARSVASRLGHADPSMTLRVYAHALEADDRQIAAELGRALSVEGR